ncbi:hypothetical protein [Ectobacillus antri]|uniref:hypothetical protein n=1 Tax=Ectobacillus antri TaxID=2486280 RepID=UPI000F598DF7|nr:hypothetical protein [Ectobacillus antri]
MITKEKSFKTSVNIKFDLGKEEFVNRYLPTPSHADSLLGLLKGFTYPEQNYGRSHIIMGPYGTGKSLIATIVGNLISKNLDKFTLQTLVNKFHKVHEDIYEVLQQVNKLERKYLPVVLNGNEGRFRQALLTSIIRTLNENNIEIILPGQYGTILETVGLWEEKYKDTFRKFKRLLKDETGKDIETWRIEILNQEKTAVDWFISSYPQLTSGARFVAEYNEGFIEQIKQVLDQLKSKNLGLFIAYDEFGRFLQTLESHEIHETMQDLQDLSELTDHYGTNLHLLLITHRNLRQYFGFLHEDFKNEFQRIEKRFKVYNVESDKATFIRLADNIIQDLRGENKPDEDLEKKQIEYLRKYPLFPELNQQEIEKIIVNSIYPVHPVTLYLLPFLSSRFGQNERTLFTFLESDETGGLRNHMKKFADFYLASDLFTYFFPNIYDIDTTEEEFEALRIYKSLINKQEQLIVDSRKLKLVQFISLWQLVGLQSRVKLDTEFLCFAMNWNENELIEVLKELSLSKVIRYVHKFGYWELMECSSVSIEEIIQEKIAYTANSRQKRLAVLDKCLSKRYYFANEYNDQKSITRYAQVKFIYGKDILHESVDFEQMLSESASDAIIFYILLEDQVEFDEVVHKVQGIKNELLLFCIVKLPFSVIEEQVIEYSAIEMLLSDAELLQSDKNLKKELILRKEDLHFVIQEFLSKFTSYTSEVKWIMRGKLTDIRSEIMLENIISKQMEEIFPYTPEVRNDSFNRRIINNVQRKAGYVVLDHVINNLGEDKLGITGQGPDYLIYATIFKNNNLDVTNLNDIESTDLKQLREALLSHLTKNSTGNLQQFVDIMKRSPFGIREPLLPIYFVTLLRDKWDQIMIYRNELFIAGINGEKLYKIFEEAKEYQYVFHNFDDQYHDFFTILEKYFGEFENELLKNKPLIIRLNSALLTWLRGLPRFVQITDTLNDEDIWLRDVIRRSEINPQEVLNKLFKVYGDNFEQLLSQKENLETYFSVFKKKLQNEVMKITNVSSFNELTAWAQQQQSHIQKQNNFVKSILKTNDSTFWIEELARYFIGIELENWSDTTCQLFKNQLKADYDKIYLLDEEAKDFIQLNFNGKVKTVSKVPLSTKSNVIYQNVERMLKNAGRNVTKDEIEYLIVKLVEEFIE